MSGLPPALQFFRPKAGERPQIKILDQQPAFYEHRLPQPKFAPGDWVVWTVRWPRGAGDSPAVPRMARVSKVTQEAPFRPFAYHLRLREPIEFTGGRRWAYQAPEHELRLPDVVDRLAQLAG